ncbi:MAG TPA: hypothetical protein DDW36_01285 [Candidatus Magasanikbacteria bacterium]|nr:hypothetical protein [Candidatus Magasanikbacteria bacterium]
MIKKHSMLVWIAAVIIFIGVMGYFSYRETGAGSATASVNLNKMLKERPEYADLITNIQKVEEEVKKDPGLVERYAQLGLAWKSLAEQTKDKAVFSKARDAYIRGIELTGRRSSIYLLNAGVVSELMEEYTEAERYYQMAVESTPGDAEPYLKLASLYRLFLNKSKEEIMAVYDKGIATVVLSTPIIQAKAEYLRSTGDGKAALPLYEELYRRSQNQQFKNSIDEIKQTP